MRQGELTRSHQGHFIPEELHCLSWEGCWGHPAPRLDRMTVQAPDRSTAALTSFTLLLLAALGSPVGHTAIQTLALPHLSCLTLGPFDPPTQNGEPGSKVVDIVRFLLYAPI